MAETGTTESSSPDSWDALEEQLWQFEQAWQRKTSPAIREFLGQTIHSQSQQLLVELIKIDVEYRWKDGQDARIEEYFEQYPELDNDLEILDEILAEEIIVRCNVGNPPDENELRSRFPDRADELIRRVEGAHVGSPATLPPKSGSSTADQNRQTIVEHSDGNKHGFEAFCAGAKIGRYILKERVGSGSFSTVWRAFDSDLERDVAIKVLRGDLCLKETANRRMMREARAVAGLEHPSIVQVHEVGELDGCPYIVSQFVDGPTLNQLVDNAELHFRQAAGIARDIALGVDYAHQHGVIHRDIKPANVLMANDEKPMIADFGLAHQQQSTDATLTKQGDIIGTPAFMSPEQARGDHRLVDARTDLYSVGAVLYLMLARRLPLEGSASVLIHRVIHERPAPIRKIVPSIPRDLETITLKCLEKEPSDRYRSCDDLADELSRFLNGESIVARPPGPPERMWRWARRYPRVAAMMIAILLLAGFLSGAAIQLQHAIQQRNRARSAEQESKTLLARSSADAGRLSMQRGQLKDALQHFDRCLELDYEDPVQLRLWRIEVLVATRQIALAQAELDSLLVENRADDHQAEVLLWKAELAAEGVEGYGQAEELFEQAADLELNNADQNYVQAMIATNSPHSVEFCQQALDANPFHHRARRMLVILKLSLADFQGTLDEIGVASQLFPNDHDFGLLKSLALSALGNTSQAHELIDQLPFPDEEKQHWKKFADWVSRLRQDLSIDEAGGFHIKQLADLAERFMEDHYPLVASRGWHFPPRIGKRFEGLPARLAAKGLHNQAGLVEELDLLTQAHPEGSLFAMLGGRLLSGQFTPPVLRKALVAFQSSLQHPAYIEDSAKVARRGVFSTAVKLALVHQENVEQNTRAYVEAATEIDPESIVQAGLCRVFVIALIQANELDVGKRWAERYIAAAKSDRNTLFDALWHRGIIAQREGADAELIRLCDRMLELLPENSDVKYMRDEATKRLKKLSGKLTDSDKHP